MVMGSGRHRWGHVASVWLLAAAATVAHTSGEQSATDWIRGHAIPLQTVEAVHGFDDLQPLAQVVGDARIVALGEATHGTREFFQLKHRIIEFLATQKGFTIFSIEANMPEAYRLNDFVLNGRGEPKQLLKGLYFWTWDTEEVLNMILWMREFNRSGRGPIEFTGFDMQKPTVAMDIVRQFLRGHDDLYYQTVDPIYSEVGPAIKGGGNSSSVALAGRCKDIVAHLQADRGRLIQAGSKARDVDWVIQNARLVLQSVQLASGGQTRDQSMAENVEWIADQNPGAKIVLWAANGHIQNSSPPGFDPMGGYLHQKFGQAMVNFGFSFNEGSFRAIETGKSLREFTVGPLREGSLDRTFASVGIPLFALDFRQLPKKGPVARWFAKQRAMRSIGALYDEKDPNSPMAVGSRRWQEAFDVILFVEKTTASHPNP